MIRSGQREDPRALSHRHLSGETSAVVVAAERVWASGREPVFVTPPTIPYSSGSKDHKITGPQDHRTTGPQDHVRTTGQNPAVSSMCVALRVVCQTG